MLVAANERGEMVAATALPPSRRWRRGGQGRAQLNVSLIPPGVEEELARCAG